MLRRLTYGILVALALAAWSAPAKAVLIAYWDFNDGDLIADQGAGTITPSLLNNMNLQFVTGTTVNAQVGVLAGQALKVNSTGLAGPLGTSGQFQLDIELDLSGFSDFVMTAALRSDPSWRSNQIVPTGVQITWQASADGGASFVSGLQFVPNPVFTAQQVSQNSFNNIAGSPDALVRILQNPIGIIPGEGFYIDNLLITGTAVPQPPSVSEPGTLMALGLGLAALGLVRRRRTA